VKAGDPDYVIGSDYTPAPILIRPKAVIGLTCDDPENPPGGTVHTPADPAFALIILILLVTLGYLARVWLRPFKTCRRCEGMGRIRTRNGRGRPKPCKRCGGKGLRPRAFHRPQRAAARVLSDAQPETTRRAPAGSRSP
jgi:hypothetical protein